jgi:hypothetical protein
MNRTKYLKGECGQCGGHLEFPAEATGLTTDCPHCGKPTELMLARPREEPAVSRRVIVWTASAVLILGLGLVGALVALNRAERYAARQKAQAGAKAAPSVSADTQAAPAPQPEDPVAKAGFKVGVISLEKTTNSSLVYAVGTIANATNRQRFGVKVELDLFDEAGRKVGSAKDYQAVLEPRGRWQFKALVVDSKARTAKVAAISEDQ